MEFENVNTWDELSEYLLERIHLATDEASHSNSSFTKKQHWDSVMGQCIKWSGQKLPVRTVSILKKSVYKDFK